ncbi:hypothetical protein C8Q74DRAFT_361421 [Fomes fomentarius]|nr:hypothetical protein C8Q74DRAFT_361421 [Fomes fomentarius]
MFAGVSQLVIGGLQIARVYALWNCRRAVLGLLGAISVIVCIISGWAMSHTWQTHCVSVDDDRLVQQTQCDPSKWRAQGYYLAAAWAAALLFDATVFSLTVYRVLRVGEKCKGSLFSLLLRDGALYFGVLLACHVANIFACIFAQPAYRDACVTIANAIATTLISRVMLNIRNPDRRTRSFYWLSSDHEV